MQAQVKKRKTGTKPHKQPKRRCLAARSHVQHIELEQTTQGNTRESTQSYIRPIINKIPRRKPNTYYSHEHGYAVDAVHFNG
jgi:hypothetical protein